MLALLTKSYRNDFGWLEIAVKSVRHFCKEPVSWTVVVENSDRNDLCSQEWAKTLRVVATEDLWPEVSQIPNPYHRQQFCKMYAHRIMNGYFWHWDSDLHAKREFTSENFKSVDGKPIYWISEYNSITTPTHQVIFDSRRDLLKRTLLLPEVSLEFMRCMPVPGHSEILKHGSEHPSWGRYFDAMKGDNAAVSEFNLIGQFALLNFPWLFSWKNAEREPPTWGSPDGIVSQAWSWGGVPEDLKKWSNSL